MSTLALVGLLVVLLVAIGIAGFLLRGRRGASADPDPPPRTVAELVDRRRGEDDGRVGSGGAGPPDGRTSATGASTPASAGADVAEARAEAPADAGTETTTGPTAADDAGTGAGPVTPPSGQTAGPGADATAGPSAEGTAGSGGDVTAGSGRDAAAAAGADAAVPGGTAAAVPGADAAVPGGTAAAAPGAGTAVPGGTAAAGSGVETAPGPGTLAGADAGPDAGSAPVGDDEDTDTAPLGGSPPAPDDPAQPRPGSDADTGPSSPPWSRGFVEGRQITPPAPAPTREPGRQPVGDEAERPSPPPRQESRSPVDPDLVKRVTSVPSATGRRASDPDTEREFREARDRMAGPAVVRHSPVPEQSSRSPESAAPSARRRPYPVTPEGEGGSEREATDRSGRGGSAAVVAGGMGAAAVAISRSGSSDEDDGPAESGTAGSQAARPSPSPFPRAADRSSRGTGEEPPPRPSPRVMRSAGPIVADPADDRDTAAPSADASTPEPTSTGGTAVGVGSDPVVSDAVSDPAVSDSAGSDPAGPDPAGAGPAGADVVGDDLVGVDPADETAVDAVSVGTETVDADLVAEPGAAPEPAEGEAEDPRGTDRAGWSPGAAEPEQVVAFTGSSPVRLGPVQATPVQDVDVHVADRSERPLAGVALSVVDGAGAPAGSGTTGTTGDARLRAPGAGQYLLVASVDGYQTRVAPYAVADEPVRVPVTLARSSTLRGIVRGPAGEPRAGVSVSLGQDGQDVARTDTGSDGTYRFSDLATGHYLLTVGERPGARVHVPPEADVEQDVRSNDTESV